MGEKKHLVEFLTQTISSFYRILNEYTFQSVKQRKNTSKATSKGVLQRESLTWLATRPRTRVDLHLGSGVVAASTLEQEHGLPKEEICVMSVCAFYF